MAPPPLPDQERLRAILAFDLQPRIDWAYALEQQILTLSGGGLTAWGLAAQAEYVFAGDPNGLVTAAGTGDLLLDTDTPALWIADGPGTAWTNPGGGGGGAVDSVNGQTGGVVLDAGDVGADPAGSAASAQAAAEATAANASNLTSGTVADGRIAASIARDSEVTTAVGNEATARDAAIVTERTTAATLINKTLTAPVVNSPTGIVKGDVGLGNVDNTSNATERAATATLTNKTLTSPVINTPTGIVKADVGLGGVDNTADTAKPVSTAQQTALDFKAPLASPTLTGTPAAPTAAQGTNTTQVATTAYVQTEAGLLVPKSLFDANTILAANSDDTPAAVSVAEQTLVGRITGGSIDDLSVSQIRTLLAISAFGASLVDDADAATARATLGVAGAWDAVADLASNQTTTSTTLVDIPGLSVPVVASARYEFEVVLRVLSGAEASGTRYGVNLSAGTGGTVHAFITGTQNTTTTVGNGVITALAVQDSVLMMNGASFTGTMLIKGTLLAGNADANFTAQFLKVTAGTATVIAGSTLKIRRIV